MLFGGFAFSQTAFNDVKISSREHWRVIDIVNPESWTDVQLSGTGTWTTISPSDDDDESWVDISTRII
jgi:hypothetical protein